MIMTKDTGLIKVADIFVAADAILRISRITPQSSHDILNRKMVSVEAKSRKHERHWLRFKFAALLCTYHGDVDRLPYYLPP